MSPMLFWRKSDHSNEVVISVMKVNGGNKTSGKVLSSAKDLFEVGSASS